MLGKILIKRLGLIPIQKNYNISISKKITFLTWCAWLWYEFKNSELYNDSVLNISSEIIDTLTEIRWGSAQKVPLFLWFPENTPDDTEYYEKRIFGYIWNYLGLFNEWKKLENGIIIPEWLFDCNQFWADPITQFQDAWMFTQALEAQKQQNKDTHIEMQTLTFVPEEIAIKQLKEYLENILYSKSSISESIHEELEFLIDYFWIDTIQFERVVFKEIKSFISKYLWNQGRYDRLTKLISTPTDFLRLFASLTSSDISLANKIKFPKFKRSERRFILWSLEKFWDLTNDFYKYSSLWKRLWEYLHPWEYSRRYPKTYLYFQLLREDRLQTYDSKIQKALSIGDIENVINLLKQKPWIFARKLHEVLEKSWNWYVNVLNAFQEVWERVELKNLMIMRYYFQTIETSEYKTIINKKWSIKILENKKHRLPDNVDILTVELLNNLIISKLKKESCFNKVNNKTIYISKALKNITIPLSSRKAVDGYYRCWRWSRFKIDMEKTLRLFAYWKQIKNRTDLDLSVIFFNDQMKAINHVSYTQLKTDWAIHSWDIQSAPNGAVEYVDIDLRYFNKSINTFSLKKSFFWKNPHADVKYIAVQIYKYSGDDFDDIECFAWWQIRNKINSDYKSFDEKTVANKFDLYGNWSYFMPIILDIEREEIVYTDLAVNSRTSWNNVENSLNTVELITKQALDFHKTKPNIYDLVAFHAKSQSLEIIDYKESADIICDVTDWDYNIKNSEKILSELL